MSRNEERSLGSVPLWLFLALGISLATQIGFHHLSGTQNVRVRDLDPPPSEQAVRLYSLNSPTFASHLMMLWLQSFDVQPGISLSFNSLNYSRIKDWLRRILALNPKGQYPLLSAVRVYAEVTDPERQREMLDFAAQEFGKDPANRWPWLAHAVYVAKHRLEDKQYALALANLLSAHDDEQEIPSWAKQMRIFVLEDMGELESAKVLLGGLLESGKITDPHEQWFLSNRLAELEDKLAGQAARRRSE